MVAISHMNRLVKRIPTVVWALGIGTSLLLTAPIYNGFPLVFPDTGTYIRQALELQGSMDRPPYYSIVLVLTNGSISLWLSAIAQCVAVSALIYTVSKIVCGPSITLGAYAALMAGLSLLTSLPWVAGQILPDIWTAGLVLLVFWRTFEATKLCRLHRILFIIAVGAVTAFHYGNLPLLGLLVITSAAIVALRDRGWSAAAAILFDGAATIVLVASAFLAFSLVASGQAKLSPIGNIFFSARLIADGSAIPYLEESCPVRPTPYCGALTHRRLTSDEILWSDNTYLNEYGFDERASERDAAEIVRNTLRTNLLSVLAASIVHTGEQLLAFASFDTECPELCGQDYSVYRSIAKHYPRDFASFAHSRQMAGTLPLSLNDMHMATAWFCACLLPILFVWSLRMNHAALTGLIVLASAGLIGNAVTVGTFSQVHDRYQSRMIWLVPMIAGLALILLLSRRGTRVTVAP